VEPTQERRRALLPRLGLSPIRVRSKTSSIIAEGVETRDELTTLAEAGIDLFQGFLFAKPALESLPAVSFAI